VSNRRGAFDRDFGRLCRGAPVEILHTESEGDVQAAIARANETGLPLTIRGSGHSAAGQTVSRGGLLMVNRGASTPPRLDGDLVDVEGRALWRDVERRLGRAGRTVPVLADYLDLTVGGTLSVGGYGVESVQRGVQADHVERLRLVLPDGSATWCSAAERPELFELALAGLGQVGVIERAVLRTVPSRPFMTLFVYRHPDLADLIDSMAWLADRGVTKPEFFKALASRGRIISVYGVPAGTWSDLWRVRPPTGLAGRPVSRRLPTVRYRQGRSLAVSAWLAAFPGQDRLWSDYLLDHAGLRAFGRFLHEEMRADAFAGCLRAIYVVAIRRLARQVRIPFEATDGLSGDMAFGVGLYSMIPRHRPERLAAVRQAASRSLQAALELGGRPYRYGWHDLDESAHRQLYGDAVDRVADLRRRLDPNHVFHPRHEPDDC
jgi:FAD/FMN-containing dehydrogenase